MTTQEITVVIEAATQLNLNWHDVTGAINSSPTPYQGAFIYGFKTWEEAEGFQAKHGGEVGYGYWKNGWGVSHYKGQRGGPFIYNDYVNDLGDNYGIAGSKDDELKIIVERVADSTYSFNDPDPTFQPREKDLDELGKIIANGKSVLEEIDKANGNEVVITYAGAYYETVPTTMMYYTEDTHHHAIGVYFAKD